MKVGIMQPYFMPYIGYWQLIKAVNKYVVYDDVNYIKGGWINRNNIILDREPKRFTIILKGASPNKKINEIEIGDDFGKFLKSIKLNYSKAPFFHDVMPMLESICSFKDKQLGLFIYNSIKEICSYLGITTEILLSSKLEKNNSLAGKDKVLDICHRLDATEYYNAIGGKELYNKEEFASHGIRLSFLRTEFTAYPQFSTSFIKGLSIIDLLMFNSIEDMHKHLDNFILE